VKGKEISWKGWMCNRKKVPNNKKGKAGIIECVYEALRRRNVSPRRVRKKERRTKSKGGRIEVGANKDGAHEGDVTIEKKR
jgi:hypothetical protein